MQKVLVTGATGFTGYFLAQRLSQSGFHVVAPLRENSDVSNLKKLSNIEIVTGDITNRQFIEQIVNKDIYAIFHLAAAFRKANVPKKIYWDVNYNSTKYLLEEAASKKIKKFIHCSTGGVLGHIKNPPATETAPYAPGDIYQKSKCEGEKLVISYFQHNKIQGSIIRPTAIYGPGDLRLLKFFKLIKNKKFIMLGQGTVFYHMVYISDLVDAFLLCLKKDAANGEIFIIGGEQYVSLNQLVQLIAKSVQAPSPKIKLPFWPVWALSALIELFCAPFKITPPIYRRRIDLFRKSRAFDISKAKKILGFQPKVNLETGISLTAKWYKQNNLI